MAADFHPPAPQGFMAVLRRVVTNLVGWVWSMVSLRRIRPGQRWPVTARPVWLLLGAVVAVALIACTMLLLDGHVIMEQRSLSPTFIRVFESITDAGQSGWVLGPLAALIFVAAVISSPALGRTGQLVLASLVARAGFMFMAVAVPGIVVTIVKRFIGRARPYLFEKGGPLVFEPFRWDPNYASLPSGHTTTAFAAAFAIGALFPRLRWPIWILAAVIAVSRVIVSAHYPSDILAAAFIGTLGAIAVRNWFAMRRLGFRVTSERGVETLPGPSWRRLRRLARRVPASLARS